MKVTHKESPREERLVVGAFKIGDAFRFEGRTYLITDTGIGTAHCYKCVTVETGLHPTWFETTGIPEAPVLVTRVKSIEVTT